MAKKKSFYDEYAYKRLKNLGFDTKFANKVAKRANAIEQSLKLEELAGKVRGDTSVAKDIFEGKTSKDWTRKQRQNFIQGENEYRIDTKGKFGGQLTEKEKKMLDIHLKEGDVKFALHLAAKDTIDEQSRLEKFKQWIGYKKTPPKYIQDEIKKINKEMGLPENAKNGMFVLREMQTKGKSKEEAIKYVNSLTSPINKEEVFYT